MQETQETQVQSLSWEDSLEKEMATHSSILAWEIPWSLEGCGPQGCRESDTAQRLITTTQRGRKSDCCLSLKTIRLKWEQKGLHTIQLPLGVCLKIRESWRTQIFTFECSAKVKVTPVHFQLQNVTLGNTSR